MDRESMELYASVDTIGMLKEPRLKISLIENSDFVIWDSWIRVEQSDVLAFA